MKKLEYEMIFEVTETLQNGNERIIKKSVFISPFTDGKHTSPEMQIERGEAALKEEHYYNIKHIETKKKYIIYA